MVEIKERNFKLLVLGIGHQEFIHSTQELLDFKQQILQDHEDAKKWDDLFTELAKNFYIEDIDWNGGDINFKIFFGKLEKYRQIVKRLEERIKEIPNEIEVFGGESQQSHMDWLRRVLQKILSNEDSNE